ncbi:MAG: chromosome segregation protein SMC [Anaerolineales bacterium]
MAQRLKILELQGYKTFATKTVFAFSSSVTAIVGPNGSGKSNIADAIRWVLGEQSYTLLRGRKTEDMIFSGSELRARAGMAQATMVFDNSDQWLPIEFNEVAITRRAYRDGQNEYLINGQRVRLKDVNELLGRSGLAERTYTVIGQGLVDVALALKAEDRRQLFEEAAGIGIYRDRREEALRRLEATRRNIQRVYDLLSEIEPRLRSLERQVKRLEEYEQIRSALKELLLEWYGYHWHREQKELILQKDYVRQREQAILELRQKLSTKEAEATQIRVSALAKREQLGLWQEELNHLNEDHYVNARQLAVLHERHQSYLSNRMELATEFHRLLEENKYLKEKLQEAQQEQATIEDEYHEIAAKAEAARLEFEQQRINYEEKKSALDRLNSRFNELLRQNAESEARLSELTTRRIQRFELLQERRAAIATLEKEILSQQEELKKITEELTRWRQEIARCQVEMESARAEEQSKLAQQREKQKERAKLDADRVKLATQLEVLEQADRSLVDYSQAVQVLFQRHNREQVLGVLGSMLHVQAEYETAIAAYLGEFVDTVFTRDLSSALSLTEFLSGENLRGVLYPMRGKKKQPESPEIAEKGVVGWVKDLVKIDPAYDEVLENIFHGVLLVEDAKVAFELQRKMGEPPLIVTLKGELFYPQGLIVSAGKVEAGKLRRPREKEEIRKKLLNLEQQIRVLDLEISALSDQIATLQNNNHGILEKQNQLKEKEIEVEKKQRQASQELERLQIRHEMLRKQLDELDTEINTLQREIDQERKKSEELKQQIPSLETQLRQQSQLLAEVSLEQLQRRVGQWDAYLRATERSLSAARERTKERLQQLELSKQNLCRIEEKRAEIEKKLKEIDSLKQALQQEEQESEQRQTHLLEKIDPLKQDIEASERQMETLSLEIQELQRTILQQEQTLTQLRIALTRQQERFDSLRRKIEEDFGLVAFEYEEDVSGPRPLPLEGMVEILPAIVRISPELEENIRRYRHQLRRLGPVSPEAKLEYDQVKERYQFMQDQIADLLKAEENILEILRQLDVTIRQDFLRTYEAVAEEFKSIFSRLFKGGSARLLLTDSEDLTSTGVEIEARLPGKRTQGLSLLSGGERSLTAVALIFALLKVSPTPFCVLDEVDAMLDEANIGRFQEVLKELSQNTQFIIVTHNRNTVQVADIIYGVTMGRDSTSQVISLKLDELDQVIGSRQ